MAPSELNKGFAYRVCNPGCTEAQSDVRNKAQSRPAQTFFIFILRRGFPLTSANQPMKKLAYRKYFALMCILGVSQVGVYGLKCVVGVSYCDHRTLDVDVFGLKKYVHAAQQVFGVTRTCMLKEKEEKEEEE